jgi:serine protease
MALRSGPPPLIWRLATLLVAGVAVWWPIGTPGIDAQRGHRAPVVGRAALPPPARWRDRESVDALADAAVRRLDHVPGEVLVKFRTGIDQAGRTRVLSALRGRPVEAALEWRGPIARLRAAGEPDAERLAARLRLDPEVEFAQPNYIRRIPARVVRPRVGPIRVSATASPSRVPTDPSFAALQWNMRLIDAPGAWTINPGGSAEVIVGVLDSGLTTSGSVVTRPLWTGQRFEDVPLRFEMTPDLAPSRVVSARDLVFEPGGSPFDLEGHGTHVASTIAEEANNAIGLAGLAYNVRVMPVKVCLGFWDLMLLRASFGITGYLPSDAGGCTDADISDGVRYAVDAGARVINISLGGPGESPVVREALEYAVSRGAFVAVAMGNGYEQGNDADYPAVYAPMIAGVMSVGAVGKSKTRAYYSSTGPHIEVTAPGGSDRDDDGGEDEGFVWQITLFPPDTDPLETPRPRFDRYVEVGYIGTSMATPHVSALAALLISQGIRHPAAIEATIKRSASDLGTAGRDDEHGSGLIQARTALYGLGVLR